ncbi:Exosome complex component CSL4 [Aphanomyces cochlioides]|nr:Exosome complex component CSL4 [Aphanomyces cochlioides]
MASAVIPGQRLGKEGDYMAGSGTYVMNGNIFASVAGFITPVLHMALNVERPATKRIATQGVPRVDDFVVGKITKVTPSQLQIDIHSVNDTVLLEPFAGTLRKEDVRPMEIDKLQLEEMFRPGDVIKAVVLSFGDSRSYFLTTAKPGLGVMQIQ